MNPRKRLLLLIVIMSSLVVATLVISIGSLYRAAIREESTRLAETAKSQARLIEAIARFNITSSTTLPADKEITLRQIREAHSHYEGFGETGEFTLAERQGGHIVFLLNHRHFDLDNPQPVPWNSAFAQPMRLALSGKSGIVTGLDYRGVRVIAAYEPVAVLNLGIVAKIDRAEIVWPFVRAAILATIVACIFMIIGTNIFFRVTNPIINKLNETVTDLQQTLNEIKTLRGILPICSYCKKIRDDDGYWSQVEDYVSRHSDADFSHGICPGCLKEHFPDVYAQEMTDKNSPIYGMNS